MNLDPQCVLSMTLSEVNALEVRLAMIISQYSSESTAPNNKGPVATDQKNTDEVKGQWRLHVASCNLASAVMGDRDNLSEGSGLTVFMIASGVQHEKPSAQAAGLQRMSSVTSLSSSSLGNSSLASSSLQSPMIPNSVLSMYAMEMRPSNDSLPLITNRKINQINKTVEKAIFDRKILHKNTATNHLNEAHPTLYSGSQLNKTSTLTSELFGSLKKMEAHTIQIKKGIAIAQELVNIRDPRARGMLFKLGVDRMKIALQKLVRIDLRRGFEAWKLQQRESILRQATGLLLRLLGDRNILAGLEQVLKKLLRANFEVWKRIAHEETLRLRKKVVLDAALKIQVECFLKILCFLSYFFG